MTQTDRTHQEWHAFAKGILGAAQELGIIIKERRGYSGPEILLLLEDVKNLAIKNNEAALRQEKLEDILHDLMVDINRVEDDDATDSSTDTFGVSGNISYNTVAKARDLLKGNP